MRTSILNKLSKEGRAEVIQKEAELRELDEGIAEIDQMDNALSGNDSNGMLGRGKKGGWW